MHCRYSSDIRRLPPVCQQLKSALFDHLVSSSEERGWNGQAERSGGLQIDYQLKPSGLLYRQIARLGALQNLIHVGGTDASSQQRPPHRTTGIDPSLCANML